MTIRFPSDIEALVVARVDSGEFASAEEVVRMAMAPWIERERARAEALAEIRAKIADGDADPSNVGPIEMRQRLDRLASELSRSDPNAT